MNINADLAALRQEYQRSELSEDSAAGDPFSQFAAWMNETLQAEIPEPSAMTLATASVAGKPSSRIVLLKGFDADGFVFFTNYESRKGTDLNENPQAVIQFFWAELERQINISGSVARVTEAESDEYFASRPFESRIGAWASDQSRKITSRKQLEDRVTELLAKYPDGNVPRPPHWGGYRLSPERVEFWQGRPSRLHDRICYDRNGGEWIISRLSP